MEPSRMTTTTPTTHGGALADRMESRMRAREPLSPKLLPRRTPLEALDGPPPFVVVGGGGMSTRDLPSENPLMFTAVECLLSAQCCASGAAAVVVAVALIVAAAAAVLAADDRRSVRTPSCRPGSSIVSDRCIS